MLNDSSPLAPLPGFQPSSRGLFVDRWGTLLDAPARGWCARPRDLVFHQGAIDALFRAHRAGWTLYLIGNEEQVARGRQSDASFEKVQTAIEQRLADHGVVLRRFYACLDHPQGKGAHARDSVFQLPNTGTFYQAAHLDGISLRDSWVLGDQFEGLVAGWRAGLHVAGVATGQGLSDELFEVEPAFVAAGLGRAVETILDAEKALAA